MSLGLLTSSLRAVKNLKETQYDRVLGLVSARLIDKDGDFSHILQRKSRLQLVLLSCAVCGIEFCYSAETAFVSPILLQIGLPATYMSLVWCLSPFLGFFMVPVLGSMSDRCQSRLGRRRPFILGLSVGIIMGLLLVPHGRQLGIFCGDTYTEPSGSGNTTYGNITDLTTLETPNKAGPRTQNHPWGVVFTVIGVMLLDFCCDGCQSPCRTYLLDVTIPADHSMGLTTFTVMAGSGGSIGYIMGAIDWHTTKFTDVISSPVNIIFTMVLVIYLIFLFLTITAIKEVPLSKLGVTKEQLQGGKKKVDGVKYKKFANESGSDEETPTSKPLPDLKADLSHAKTYGTSDRTSATNDLKNRHETLTENGPVDHPMDLTMSSAQQDNSLQFYQQTPDGKTQPDLELCGQDQSEVPLPPISDITLTSYLKSIIKMPRSLRILCLTNLFCWMSLVCYSLFFTDFVGQAVYEGDPRAAPGTDEHALYEQGVRTGCMGMSLYSLSCAIYSLCIEWLVKKFSARSVYMVSQLVYTVGALVMAVTRDRYSVVVFSPCAGIMYATLFTMPYLLVAHYHSTGTFEAGQQEEKTREHSTRGLGTDIAVVSSMVFVAQFLLSACMGSIVDATGTTASVMGAAALLSLLGACSASQVTYLDL